MKRPSGYRPQWRNLETDPADRGSYAQYSYDSGSALAATAVAYSEPVITYVDPILSSQPTNYQQLLAAQNAARWAVEQADALAVAEQTRLQAEAIAQKIAAAALIAEAKKYETQRIAEELRQQQIAAAASYAQAQADEQATAAQIAWNKLQVENAVAAAAQAFLAAQQEAIRHAAEQKAAEEAARQLDLLKASEIAAREAAAAAARLEQVVSDPASSQAEITAATTASTTATNNAKDVAATTTLLTSKSPLTEAGMKPIYIAGALAIAGILTLIFKK